MKFSKSVSIILMVALMAVFAVMPAAAQEASDPGAYPVNTITVVGMGDANGSPDMATLEVGVESINEDVAVAFAETNDKIETIINALVEAGVARRDIRTSGLNIWQDRSGSYGSPMGMPMVEPGQPNPVYVVSNNVSITVRDITTVAEVINAAVTNGANNLYGLNFGIDDRAALETEARTEAFADAQSRAEELAALIGAELGEAIIVNENFTGGYYPPVPYAQNNMVGGMGGGGAVIEPGQLSVSMQVQVTFRINR